MPVRIHSRAIKIVLVIVLAMILHADAAVAVDIPPANSLPVGRFLKVAVLPSSARIDAFAGGGRGHVAYEIYLANFTGKTVRILALHVTASGPHPFAMTLRNDQLARSFSTISDDYSKPHRPIVKPAESGVIFVFLDFPSLRTAPDQITNAVDLEVDGSNGTAQRIEIKPMAVSKDGAIVIHAPLSGSNWLAANGPSNTSLHRRTIFVVDGDPRVGQRFAIDWVKLGPDGRTYKGDPKQNGSYLAYDAPVMAIADGHIVSVIDGLPENVPNSSKLAVELNLRNAGGNSVAEDLGGGRYAMYAHMRPGSIAVKPGDTVRAGQVIGHVGNTGSSSEPHLHLQVCDAPSFLASSGIPYEIDSFTVADYQIDHKGNVPAKLTLHGSHKVSDQEPMENQLVSFSQR